MIAELFYDRRRQDQPVPSDRRTYQRRTSLQPVSEERRRLMSQTRRHDRSPFRIPVEVKVGTRSAAGYARDIGERGLGVSIAAATRVPVNTPVTLSFRSGEAVRLTAIPGRVAFCGPAGKPDAPQVAMGVQFSSDAPLEQKLLLSVAQALNQETVTGANSFLLTIDISPDALTRGAARTAAPTKTIETIVEVSRTAVTDSVGFRAAIGEKLSGFHLLINGQDIDTGRYEFAPVADRLIAEYKRTTEIVEALKRSEIRDGFERYVYAFQSIGGAQENAECLRAASEAAAEFKTFSLSRRTRILKDIFDLLVAHEPRILELLVLEGHPARLAEWEFDGMKKVFCPENLEYGKRMLVRKIGEHGAESIWLARKPDGVVGVIPPGNASCSNSIIAVGALWAGNALVIKPPLKSAGATMFLWRSVIAQALRANGAPPGTVNLILGDSRKLLQDWMDSPYLNDIFFFGESALGLDVGAQAFARGKKPILELSGNDMLIVWRDANLAEAVDAMMDGFLGSTQICMVPKKALVHEAIYEEFEAAFVAKVRKLSVGLPSDPTTYLAPVLRSERFFEFLDDALANGGRLLCGGERWDHTGKPSKYGTYLAPTVVRVDDQVADRFKCIQEENFFPLIPLVKVGQQPGATDDEIFRKMVGFVNNNRYGLRSSVWARSPRYIRKFAAQIDNSGTLRINSKHINFSAFLGTHGGTRFSGGPYGEMNYVWEKTSHMQGISFTRPDDTAIHG